jgi:2-(1,2-epoxy-1,2-dihydrophenyl)acetyl-CoA isomerase
MLLLGRRLSGAEAADWGLIHRSVADSDVHAEAEVLARQLANGPTVSLGLSKWLLASGASTSLDAHLRDEAFAMELSSRSEDFREGLIAFSERRDARFGGR